jgi:Mrp family chromosome partitioning ATPase
MYRATASIWITATAEPGVYTSATDLVNFAQMYAPLVLSTDVLQRALTSIGDPADPESARAEVLSTAEARTAIVDIQVTDRNPERAATLANGIAEAFATTTPNPATKLSIASFASIPKDETNRPAGPLGALAAGLLGMIAALGASLALDLAEDRVRSSRDLEESIGIRFLGSLPPVGRPKKGQPIPTFDPGSDVADRYRRLRPGILRCIPDYPTSLIVVSPSVPIDRSSILMNLAASFAEAGLRATIVDADPRSPWLAPSLGLPERAGFVDLIQRPSISAGEAVRPLRIQGVSFLSAGIAAANSNAILSSPRIHQVVKSIQETADVVLYGCAPASQRSDAIVLAAHVGQVILVVDAEHEHGELVLRAVAELERSGASIAGAVIANADAANFQFSVGGSPDLAATVPTDDGASSDLRFPQLRASVAARHDVDRQETNPTRAIVNHQSR